VTLFSVADGSLGGWKWHHLVGLVAVVWAAYLLFSEWRRVEYPTLEE